MPEWSVGPGGGFRITALSDRVAIFRDRSGLQHVLIGKGDDAVQLAVAGTNIMKPVHLLTDLTLDCDGSSLRLDAIARFNEICDNRKIRKQTAATDSPSSRLRFVLRALDGFLQGATQRDIAEALFGPQRVHLEWHDPGGHMRDYVRRALRRGRHLIGSEYRKFVVA